MYFVEQLEFIIKLGILKVHATDKDSGLFGRIQYTSIIGAGSEAFIIDPNTGEISVSMLTTVLDREFTPMIQLTVEARDEDGNGLRNTVPLIINLLDVNDNAPIFEKDSYEFILNTKSSNFTVSAVIKATDKDVEMPNNEVRYELIHGNYDNIFYLNEITGELILRKALTAVQYSAYNSYGKYEIASNESADQNRLQTIISIDSIPVSHIEMQPTVPYSNNRIGLRDEDTFQHRKKRNHSTAATVHTLIARAYDL
ncbi:cadherin-86C-like, partial [Orussus abietinus]|uniref:cadherin-86C-like n=1 Tax=Orussus abietinus TaxID=222816 RepID=UPI000C716139